MAFDELKLFGDFKGRYGVYFGKKSLLSLRDTISGMVLSRYFDDDEQVRRKSKLPYFDGFIEWYLQTYVKDGNGYAAWWNHMLYVSGNFDDAAFDLFFLRFEEYLTSIHHTALPASSYERPVLPEWGQTEQDAQKDEAES